MPKLYSQHRVQIPYNLRSSFPIKLNIAICYDSINKRIYFKTESDSYNHKVIALRKLDEKWRFVIPKEVLFALGTKNWDDIFVMYQQNGILYLEKRA